MRRPVVFAMNLRCVLADKINVLFLPSSQMALSRISCLTSSGPRLSGRITILDCAVEHGRCTFLLQETILVASSSPDFYLESSQVLFWVEVQTGTTFLRTFLLSSMHQKGEILTSQDLFCKNWLVDDEHVIGIPPVLAPSAGGRVMRHLFWA